MTPEHWHQIERVLDAVLEREPSEWSAVLDEACAADPALRHEVEALLKRYSEAEHFLEMPAAALLAEAEPSHEKSPVEGQVIGAYRLVQEIGRGGMGNVYLAERADGQFTQLVALKLLRQGFLDEHMARFRAERHILAALQHPNIAHLLDGGLLDDGTPYLVMEYVSGQPITDFCDAHSLSIDQRLDLFSQVCRAVHFAHRNLIVHRDLKPSNILVTDEAGVPQVKLLDFGIAKLLGEDSAFTAVVTRSGARLMTPEYASPEQVKGEAITTASDVYQLGVLLYELLTGHRPYRMERRKLHAIAEAILEEEPARPSVIVTQAEPFVEPEVTPERVSHARGTALERLRRRLAGDLDVICLKALRKDPERRYDSAASLAEDVRRHLAGLPVEARGDPLGYRVRKFVQRHRWGVAAAVVFALMLTGYTLTVTLQAEQVRQALGQARLETEKSEQVTNFLMELFEASNPDKALGDTLTALELLERGTVRVKELSDQPEVQAQMFDVIGSVYERMGRLEKAEPLLRQALALRREVFGNEHLDVATSLSNLGAYLRDKSAYDEAEPLLEQTLAIRRKLLGNEHEEVAASLDDLARLYGRRGEGETAEALFREALALRRRLLGDEHLDVATSLNNLALLLSNRGEYEAAEPLHREALAIYQKLLGDEHAYVATSLNNLALVQHRQGKYAAAESLYRKAAVINRKILGPEHPSLATSLYNLGSVLSEQEQYTAAEPLLREALAIRRKVLGPEHPHVAFSLNGIGWLLHYKGDYEGAEPFFREALAMFRKVQGEKHPDGAYALGGLSANLLAQGRAGEAEPLLREALDIWSAVLPKTDYRIASLRSRLGACLTALGRYHEAEPLLLKGYEDLKSSRGVKDHNTQDAIRHLVAYYEAVGEPDQVAEYRTLLIPTVSE